MEECIICGRSGRTRICFICKASASSNDLRRITSEISREQKILKRRKLKEADFNTYDNI